MIRAMTGPFIHSLVYDFTGGLVSGFTLLGVVFVVSAEGKEGGWEGRCWGLYTRCFIPKQASFLCPVSGGWSRGGEAKEERWKEVAGREEAKEYDGREGEMGIIRFAEAVGGSLYLWHVRYTLGSPEFGWTT